MSTNGNITKKYMMSIINKLPMSFIYQFFKMACYYLGFTNIGNIMEQQKLRSWYISSCANIQTMLNTLLSLSSNGKPVEGQIKLLQEKIDKAIKEANEFYQANVIEPVEMNALLLDEATDDEIDPKKSTIKKNPASTVKGRTSTKKTTVKKKK